MAAVWGRAGRLRAAGGVRIVLFGTGLEEEKARAGLTLLCGAGAFLFVSFGLLFLAGAITLLLWESNRLLALGVFAAVFFTCGGFFGFPARRHARPGTQTFAESLAQIKPDAAAPNRER